MVVYQFRELLYARLPRNNVLVKLTEEQLEGLQFLSKKLGRFLRLGKSVTESLNLKCRPRSGVALLLATTCMMADVLSTLHLQVESGGFYEALDLLRQLAGFKVADEGCRGPLAALVFKVVGFGNLEGFLVIERVCGENGGHLFEIVR